MFYEVFRKRFVLFSLGFIGFEVFCPVWALYNIKREWDTPQRLRPLPGAARQKACFGRVATSNIVPGARVPKGHAFAKRRPDRCMPCPSFCLALLRAYVTNMQFCRRPFSCPSFCLALSLSGPDEMFGQAQWQSFNSAAGCHTVSPYCTQDCGCTLHVNTFFVSKSSPAHCLM